MFNPAKRHTMYRYKNRSFTNFEKLKEFMDAEADTPKEARMLHFTGWALVGCSMLLGAFWILYILVNHAF